MLYLLNMKCCFFAVHWRKVIFKLVVSRRCQPKGFNADSIEFNRAQSNNWNSIVDDNFKRILLSRGLGLIDCSIRLFEHNQVNRILPRFPQSNTIKCNQRTFEQSMLIKSWSLICAQQSSRNMCLIDRLIDIFNSWIFMTEMWLLFLFFILPIHSFEKLGYHKTTN